MCMHTSRDEYAAPPAPVEPWGGSREYTRRKRGQTPSRAKAHRTTTRQPRCYTTAHAARFECSALSPARTPAGAPGQASLLDLNEAEQGLDNSITQPLYWRSSSTPLRAEVGDARQWATSATKQRQGENGASRNRSAREAARNSHLRAALAVPAPLEMIIASRQRARQFQCVDHLKPEVLGPARRIAGTHAVTTTIVRALIAGRVELDVQSVPRVAAPGRDRVHRPSGPGGHRALRHVRALDGHRCFIREPELGAAADEVQRQLLKALLGQILVRRAKAVLVATVSRTIQQRSKSKAGKGGRIWFAGVSSVFGVAWRRAAARDKPRHAAALQTRIQLTPRG